MPEMPPLGGASLCPQSDMLISMCARLHRNLGVAKHFERLRRGQPGRHCDTCAKSTCSISGSMGSVQIVSKYICEHLSAEWICALVPYYPLRRWHIKCKCIYCESKCTRTRLNCFNNRNSIADINHKWIPH